MANADVKTAAYCLLIEGIAVSFWTSESAAAAVDVDRDTYHVGLQHPRVSMGMSLADGWLSDSTVNFKISDVDDTLANLFAASRSDKAPLTGGIEPGDTVADTPAQTRRSRHIGTEFIGSAGERRRHPVVKDWTVGMRHPSDNEALSLNLGAVPVTTSPLLWAGRRVALYRFLYQDGAWQDWADAARIWWGTVRGTGDIRAREWSVSCDGPASWLRKSMGFAAPSEAAPVADAEIRFDGEKTVTVRFETIDNGSIYGFGTDSEIIAGNTVSDVRTAFSTAITNALADTTSNGAFGTEDAVTVEAVGAEPGGNAGFNGGGNDIFLQVIGVDTVSREGFMIVTAPERAWRALGYDPIAQADVGLLNGSDPLTYVKFSVANEGLPYYVAEFSTRNVSDGFIKDNDGAKRIYRPFFGDAQDQTYTLYESGDQEVYLGITSGDIVYCRGQWDIPCPDDPDTPGEAHTLAGGGDVDSTRLWAFFGPRRAEGSDEEFTEVWVGRCAWRNASGAVGLQDPDNTAPALYVREWLNPQAYGFPHTPGSALELGDWSAPRSSISAIPLHHLTNVADGYRSFPVLLVRNMLVGTGTSGGWYTDNTWATQQFGPGGKLKPGDNEPGFNFGLPPADREIEDLTLSVPAEMVQGLNDLYALSDSIEDECNGVTLALSGRFASEDVLLGITRPLGLCWSLRGGKYSIFAPFDGISPDDVDHTITTESYHASQPADGLQRQRFAVTAPVDLVKIAYGHDPVEREPTGELKIKASDSGARYRAQNVTVDIDAPGIHDAEALSGLLKRWRRIFEFWNRRHFELVDVALHFDETMRPGDTVRWTDAALVSADGTYGVSGQLGYITSVTHDTASRVTRVSAVLVQEPTDGYRMVAPSARVVRYDAAGPTLYCAKDHYEVSTGGFDHVDVAAFAEPAWSTYGGNASIQVLQYDGNTWTTAGYQTVSSVDTAANTITLSGTLSGGTGYYRDRDSIVTFRGFANQAADWVLNLYAPIADDAGEVGGDAADAVKWNDGD